MKTNGHVPKIPTRRTLLKAGIRIIVDVPKERVIHNVPFVNFWNIAKRGWDLVPRTYGRTDANRNQCGHFMLENTKYTHVCMLDSDHAHPEDIVERLARWVLKDPDKLVVGGLNFRRTPPFDPCMFQMGQDSKLYPPLEWSGCVPVAAVGTGCVLISRKVFETMRPQEGKPPWFAYGYNWHHLGIYPSEDMFFAQLCRENGIQHWCDTTTTSPHMTEAYITEQHFRNFIHHNPEHIKILGQDGERAAKILKGEAERV